jgi:16S rRNA (guanine527-N7)-methyltransferase
MSDAAQLEAPALAAVTDAASFAAATGATAAQIADLERLREMLADWNGRMNLVSAASLADYWQRHVLDSAQLATIAPGARVWVDIGAGAGFPGLVLAILLKAEGSREGSLGAMVHLVESQAKRCRFLDAVTDALSLPAQVHHARAEDLSLKADVVTARAVAPLTRLLGFARPYLAGGAVGLFLKSEGVEAEIAEARKAWRFVCEISPSASDPRGRVLKVEGLARV